MASFAIEIADADVETVITALCRMYNYSATIADPDNPGQAIANPETANQFANRMVRNYIRDVVTADAVNQAQGALDAARQSVANVSITDPATGA
jgi:hypothetical protein